MARHYRVAVLPRDTGFVVAADVICVDLDTIIDAVENDVQMLAARGKGNYLYLSGGGSLLLNGRYLLMVQRDAAARIHPNVWSLFTGRADGEEEWEHPARVVRELFEEVRVYVNGALVKPVCAAHQAVIDAVYAGFPTTSATLAFTPVPLPLRRLRILPYGHEVDAHVVIGTQGDVHLLYVFDVQVDLATLSAEDAEHGPQGVRRLIAAYDLQTDRMCPLTLPAHDRKWVDARGLSMSEHLRGLLTHLRAK